MSISRYPNFEPTTILDGPPMPAEAAADPRDLGLDLDDNGTRYQPVSLVRPMAVVLVLLAATLGVLFGPDVALWFALR